MKQSILFSEEQIKQKVEELATQINHHYGSKEILAIGILKGAFIFYADLLKNLNTNVTCDFCSISYYGKSIRASSEATIELDIAQNIEGKDILLIDCISDYGHTLEFTKKHLLERKAKSIKTAVLIAKPEAQKKTQIDFLGFEVPQDIFVIGYGIDFQNEGRKLPYFAKVEDLN